MTAATLPRGRADARRYSAVAMTLHWLIAALILGNIALAWYFNTQHGLARLGPIQIHKSIGITVLTLSILRVIWRFASPPPPLPAFLRGWERLAAQGVHVLFYVIMLGMPLTGWAMTSASRLIRIEPITWFGLFQWPTMTALANLPPARMKQAHDFFESLHNNGAKLAYALIAVHVLAALRHQFIRKDEILWRMLPIIRRSA
ncbi:MAG: cytochrome b [Caulobacteraceae bacterium]